ncbi:MAG: hypothetical protein LAO04_21175, partial [Acidobacteriia bacterium]|nr:hypothetical protein [Terriglobia bacterium]
APRRAYDVRKVVHAIVDDGDVFWMKPEWAKNLVTGLARVGGQPVGIVANQPMVRFELADVSVPTRGPQDKPRVKTEPARKWTKRRKY